MIVLFTARVKELAKLTKLVSFTFSIDTEIQLNSGDRLCIWKIIVLPMTLSGEYWASLQQLPSLQSTIILQSLLEDENRLNQLKELEEKENLTPDQWHTAPNSPLWNIDTLDLPNAWEESEIENLFYELDQYHLERLIEEEEAARAWREENADWYNEDYLEAS